LAGGSELDRVKGYRDNGNGLADGEAHRQTVIREVDRAMWRIYL